MSLEQIATVDAVGLDRETGAVVLSIIDSWPWTDERAHIVALQHKLNAYFEFIEGGQLAETHPDATARGVRIDVVWRFKPPESAIGLLRAAEAVAKDLVSSIRGRHVPEPRA